MTTEVTNQTAKKENRKHGFVIPKGQIDLAALGMRVNDAWANRFPSASFSFTDLPSFTASAGQFNSDILTKKDILAKRKILTGILNATDRAIEKSVKYLKAYIREEFGDVHDKEHFADFGLVMRNKHYLLPKDRDQLVVSLNATVNALSNTPSLAGRAYGLAYWTNLRDTLTTQWRDASRMDTELATLTISLQSAAPKLEDTLRRIKNQIKVDAGSAYRQAIREWGFHTEKS